MVKCIGAMERLSRSSWLKQSSMLPEKPSSDEGVQVLVYEGFQVGLRELFGDNLDLLLDYSIKLRK